MLEFIGLVVLFIFACMSVSNGSRSHEVSGWNFVWMVGIIALIGYMSINFTGIESVGALFKTVFSSTTFIVMALYFVLGLVYALVNSRIVARNEAVQARADLNKYLQTASDKRGFLFEGDKYRVLSTSQFSYSSTPNVTLDKMKLQFWFASWGVYWPFYLANNVLEDFIIGLYNHIVDITYGRIKRTVDSLLGQEITSTAK